MDHNPQLFGGFTFPPISLRDWAVQEMTTLAAKLGTTSHLSALLSKAQRLGLDAEALERLAIQRGCDRQTLRFGAAMLSAPGKTPKELVLSRGGPPAGERGFARLWTWPTPSPGRPEQP